MQLLTISHISWISAKRNWKCLEIAPTRRVAKGRSQVRASFSLPNYMKSYPAKISQTVLLGFHMVEVGEFSIKRSLRRFSKSTLIILTSHPLLGKSMGGDSGGSAKGLISIPITANSFSAERSIWFSSSRESHQTSPRHKIRISVPCPHCHKKTTRRHRRSKRKEMEVI